MLRPFWARRAGRRRRLELSISVCTCEALESRTLLSGHTADGVHAHPVFAPGTPEDYVNQFGDIPGTEPAEFRTNGRWTTTATDGGGIAQGEPVTVTWSIVPDGTNIPGFIGEPAAESDLLARLGVIYGVTTNDANYTDEPWFPLFEDTFDRWSELSGVTYVYEPNDDGAEFSNFIGVNPGALGVRGDVRIGGHFIDGNSGTLAYNFYPTVGDMVIDTADNFFDNTGSNSIRLRNVVAHEAGHGLGFAHVESNSAAFLMEPFINTNFDGPQLDDILAVQRYYGDAHEENETSGTATNLGSLSPGGNLSIGGDGTDTVVAAGDVDFVSIDDDGDVDYLRFTLTAGATVDLTLTPIGPTYNEGPQGGGQSALNTSMLSDLTLELLDTNGSSVLDTSNTGGLGVPESISQSLGAGTYYVRVTGSSNNVQLYQLDIAASGSTPPALVSSDINGGSVNRSGIGSIALTFSEAVTIGAIGDLRLFNHTTSSIVDLTGATLDDNGTSVIALNLIALATPLTDGQYTLEVPASATTAPLDRTYAISFHKLTGDVNGNRTVSFDDYGMVQASFAASVGPYGDGDADGSGLVSFDDYGMVQSNFAASVSLPALDFGDADGAGYATLLADGAARHVIDGNSLLLGTSRDGETDGQPTAAADGDDVDGGFDEDGVTVNGGALETGSSVNVFARVAGGSGFLNVWIDYNQDGDWDDAGEHVVDDLAVSTGTATIPVTAPVGSQGTAIARFRLTSTAGYSYSGLAADGEVEDHAISITNNTGPAAIAGDSLAVSTEGGETGVAAVAEQGGPLPFGSLTVDGPFHTFGEPLTWWSTTALRGRPFWQLPLARFSAFRSALNNVR